jgi:hypothetical protein
MERTSESSRRPAGRNARDTADRNVGATPDGKPTPERPADWEIGDTAGWETCGTSHNGHRQFLKNVRITG